MIRNFDYTDFHPLSDVATEKRKNGLTVSLVIPALNESATIGSVVSESRRSLVDELGLVDEIVVMNDGRSTDGTFEEAVKAGAVVHRSDSILSEYDFPHGKGTSLWKSMLVTTGDIIVCIDADIVNFDSRFVYGLVAALVMQSDIFLAKAYYDRPLELDGAVLEHQGGRVTELLVRPMLAAFYPQLARLYQPLAGEYAFRRTSVENMGFFSGYGVEIGLVLDIARVWGISHIVQVDMGVRRHRNRSIRDLGKMSFEIVQAMLKKLERYGILSMHMPLHTTMISPDSSGGFEETALEQIELPPAATIRQGNR